MQAEGTGAADWVGILEGQSFDTEFNIMGRVHYRESRDGKVPTFSGS